MSLTTNKFSFSPSNFDASKIKKNKDEDITINNYYDYDISLKDESLKDITIENINDDFQIKETDNNFNCNLDEDLKLDILNLDTIKLKTVESCEEIHTKRTLNSEHDYAIEENQIDIISKSNNENKDSVKKNTAKTQDIAKEKNKLEAPESIVSLRKNKLLQINDGAKTDTAKTQVNAKEDTANQITDIEIAKKNKKMIKKEKQRLKLKSIKSDLLNN